MSGPAERRGTSALGSAAALSSDPLFHAEASSGSCVSSSAGIPSLRRRECERLFRVREQVELGGGDESQPQMELQDAEKQEGEPVVAREASLEGGLLNLALGVGGVAREHVAQIVEHGKLGDAVLLARKAKPLLR
jgi:hypothetical protein